MTDLITVLRQKQQQLNELKSETEKLIKIAKASSFVTYLVDSSFRDLILAIDVTIDYVCKSDSRNKDEI